MELEKSKATKEQNNLQAFHKTLIQNTVKELELKFGSEMQILKGMDQIFLACSLPV